MKKLVVDDTSWETLFWSLMSAIEDVDEVVDVFEVFEQAGLVMDSGEF